MLQDYKTFHAQLSMKFQLLIKTENEDFSCFQTLRCGIYHANCWHFNIYEHRAA